MKRLFTLAALCLMVSISVGGQRPDPAESAAHEIVRFEAIDVFIDTGEKPLAAYQFELKAFRGDVMIVGIEGGEHAAFEEPPYYDPAALNNDRVIIADFNTEKDVPAGRTRLARIHVRVRGKEEPRYRTVLETAVAPGGKEVADSIALEVEAND